MAYTYGVTDLRSYSRNFVRNAADSSVYSDTNLDRAAILAMDEWCRITETPRVLGSMTLTAGSNALPTAPTNWLPEFHLKSMLVLGGSIVYPQITFTDYDEVLRNQWLTGTTSTLTGPPQMYGYMGNASASGDGICWPTPDKAYVIYQWFRQQPTTWTPGGTCSSFNLPDEHLRIIFTDGVEGYLQSNEPQNADISAAARKRFAEKAVQIRQRNATGRSGQVVTRDDPDCPNPNAIPWTWVPVGTL